MNEKKPRMPRSPEMFLPQTEKVEKQLTNAGVFYRKARCRSCSPGTDLSIKPIEERGRQRHQVTCNRCGNAWVQDLPHLSVSVPMVQRSAIVAAQATTRLREWKKMAKVTVVPDGSGANITVKIDPFSPGDEIMARLAGNGTEPTQWFKAGLPGQLPAEVLETSIPPEVVAMSETIKSQLKGMGQWVAPPEMPADLCWQASVSVEHVSYVGNSNVVLLARLSGGELENGRPSPTGIPGVVYDAVRVLKVSGSADGNVLIAPFRGAVDPDTRMPIEVADEDAPDKFRFEGHASSAPREFKRAAWAAVKAAQLRAKGDQVQVPIGWGAQQPSHQQQPTQRHQAPPPPPAETTIAQAMVGDPPTIEEEIAASGGDFTSPIPGMPPLVPPGFIDELSGMTNGAKPLPRRRVTKPVKKTSRSKK